MFRIRGILCLLAASTGLLGVASAHAATFNNQTVGNILVDTNSRPCMFFTSPGVPVVDASIAPGDPWFAVSKDGIMYPTISAMLLSAKMSGRPINVSTDGTLTCGHPTAIQVTIP